MTRRDLLRAMLATAAASTVDFEQLLWVPKPIITVPALTRKVTIHLSGYWEAFFKEPFAALIGEQIMVLHTKDNLIPGQFVTIKSGLIVPSSSHPEQPLAGVVIQTEVKK